MKKAIILCVLSSLLLAAPAGCAKRNETAGKPQVAATIFPLYDISRNITGDKMDVELILPPGASPHTFEITPQRVRNLQGTKIILKIGHGLDDWTDRLSAFLNKVQIVTVDEGINFIYEDESQDSGHHAQGGVNPHYWLSVKDAQIVANNIADSVIALDSGNANVYRQNLKAYIEELQELESQIAQRLQPYKGAKIVTFHDSWAYYAREFDLQIAATIEPFPGRQPTPKYLADLQNTVTSHNIHALFIEPQLSSESVESFVHDLGVRLYVLDPLGGVEGRDSYIQLMRYNTDTIVEALSHE
jgi:zinc transport system substrate-binding protein